MKAFIIGGYNKVTAAIIQKFLQHYSISQIMQIIDGAVVVVGMYVFGIQEMVPLTISSVLFNYNVEKKRKQWIDCILSVLRSIHGIVDTLLI